MARKIFSNFPWAAQRQDGGWTNCTTPTIPGGESPPTLGIISGEFFPRQQEWLANLGFEPGIKEAAATNDESLMEESTIVHISSIPPRPKFFVPALIREAIALSEIIKEAQMELVEDSFNRIANGSVVGASKILDVYGSGKNLLQFLIGELESDPSGRLPSGGDYKSAAKRLKISYPRVLNYDPLHQYTEQGQSLAIVGRNLIGTYGKYFGKNTNPFKDGRIDASHYKPATAIMDAPENSPLAQFIIPGGARDAVRDGQIRFLYFTDIEYNNLKRFIDTKHADYVAGLNDEDTPTLEQANESVQAASPKLNTGAVTAPKNQNPERSAKIRILNGQMTLMRHMSDLININSLTRTETDGNSTDVKVRRSVDQRRKIVECKNLINYYGEPDSLLNLINNPFSGLEDFINANNAELSTLVPKMTFFLVNDKGYRRKIQFPDHVHDYQIKKLAKGRANTDIDNMLRARSNHGTDAGVKNFTWDYEGKKPGDFVIKANLAIFFGTALDLLNDDYKAFLDTTGQPTLSTGEITKNGKLKKISEADRNKKVDETLKARQVKCQTENPPTEEQSGKIDFNSIRQSRFLVPGAQRLKLVVRVGWAYPEGKLPKGVSKSFRESIRKTQREIMLELTGYDVDYSANGQLTLNLSYAGAIDNALDHIVRANILANSDIDEEEISISKFVEPIPDHDVESEVSRTNATTYAKAAWPKGYIVRKAIKNFKPGGKFGPADINERLLLSKSGVEYELRTLQLAIRSFQSLVAKLSDKKKMESIGSDPSTGEAMNRLQMIDKWRGYEKTARIALANIEDSIREPKYAAIMNSLLIDKKIYYARIRSETLPLAASAYGKVVGGSADQTVGSPVPSFSVNFAAKQPKGNKESKAERKKRIEAALAQASSGQSPAALLDPKVISSKDFDLAHGTRNLYYIRLGDLLDNILNNLSFPKDEDYFKVILGSFFPSQLGIPGFRDDQIVMLADIPITLEYFGQFFIKAVVSPQRDAMSLKEFLDALVLSLLNPMLREVARKEGKSAPMLNNTTLFSGVELDEGEVITHGTLKSVANQRDQASMASNRYLVIGTREMSHQNRLGNEEDDLDNGIYHLKIGADRGIVKSFSFSEFNLGPQYRAMQIMKSSTGDGAIIVPQNIELTCYGNQFFPNNTLIYIDADVGFGREIAKRLGIGGYYSIVRSVHTITAGKYETVLNCVFQSSGNKDV
tara:strand:- start:3888 stop:7499 length:3612 start_codon:yes stop_codon:yes gene_type:complete